MRPENIDDAMRDAQIKMSTAKDNIRRGTRLFLFSIIRLFLETWIVQEIWNHVIVNATEVNAVTYWQTFFGMIMIRILTGQFKISFTTTRDKGNINKDNNNKTQ